MPRMRATAFERSRRPPLARPEPASARRRPGPRGDRAIGTAITIAAHVAVAAALVLGLSMAASCRWWRRSPSWCRWRKKTGAGQDHKAGCRACRNSAPPPINSRRRAPVFDIAPVPMLPSPPPRRRAPALAPRSMPSFPRRRMTPAIAREPRHLSRPACSPSSNRFKHYPAEARSAHIEGVVMLPHFIIDHARRQCAVGGDRQKLRPRRAGPRGDGADRSRPASARDAGSDGRRHPGRHRADQFLAARLTILAERAGSVAQPDPAAGIVVIMLSGIVQLHIEMLLPGGRRWPVADRT